ncbi:germ cell-less protein-like 1 [Mizuhopecten yessoensis]|uniref:germ cell-less protein-like 1 n=1 Tax=Mizuhopecten yessoensis TaxID=6573 RepID=UPI000B45A666|nr:germ cell-less protein-like 1 [Mizuhopecten yessoensis]
MGNFLTSSFERNRGRKRKIDDTDNPTQTSVTGPVLGAATRDILHTPKRKRIKSTSNYIYQTLFLNGENSDVTISALGKEWKLHKLYLSQSPYFSCMFSGSWKESSQSEIYIDVADTNINEEALKIALGSLYKDYVFIKPVQVVNVLAAAMLLQLEGLIEQCSSMMKDTISGQTVCLYYIASRRYALQTITQDCRSWLLSNLLANESTQLLQGVSIDMMTDLIISPDLSVMQVEMDVYTLLKKWMFVRLNPTWSGTNKDLTTDCDNFFKGPTNSTGTNNNTAFLTTKDGQQFLLPFCKIRWQHLLTDLASLKILEKDSIIDLDWIRLGFEHQWKEMLKMEQGQDSGPAEIPDKAVFDRLSLRCGRVLPKDGEYCWRWVGYNYGVDLLVTYMNNIITLKRNTHSQSCPHAVSLQTLRHVTYREVVVMTVDRGFNFPLHITVNLLLTTPPDSGHPAIKMDCDTIKAGIQGKVDSHCDTGVQTVCEQSVTGCDIGVQTIPPLVQLVQGSEKGVQTISRVSQRVEASDKGVQTITCTSQPVGW